MQERRSDQVPATHGVSDSMRRTRSAGDTICSPAGDSTMPRKCAPGFIDLTYPVEMDSVRERWTRAIDWLVRRTEAAELAARAALGVALLEVPHAQRHGERAALEVGLGLLVAALRGALSATPVAAASALAAALAVAFSGTILLAHGNQSNGSIVTSYNAPPVQWQ